MTEAYDPSAKSTNPRLRASDSSDCLLIYGQKICFKVTNIFLLIFKLQVVQSSAMIKLNVPGFKPKCLAIERGAACRIFEKPLETSDVNTDFTACWAIIGIVSLDTHLFLSVVTEKALVG